MSVHQTQSGAWYVLWRDRGSRKQRKEWFGGGELNRQKALRRDEEIKFLQGKTVEETICFRQLAMLYHEGHSRRESTYDNDYYKFKVLIPIIGSSPAETLSHALMDTFVAQRLASGVKRTTVARDIRLIKAVMSWAEQQVPPLIVRNPIARYKLKAANDKDVPYPPSHQEIQRLLNAAEPHLKRAILLWNETGMRPGRETLGLTWQDVDLSGKNIRIVSARKGGPAIRIVPIEGALEHLRRWFDEDSLAFGDRVTMVPLIHFAGERIGSLKTAWATAKTRAGITRRLRPYDMRHAFVTDAMRDGSDLKSVSQIIGHSRPDTTLREYQHVLTEQHREVIRRVKPLMVEA